ncbi:hypothetical protein AXG93_2396s1380 [Marchantia polymorpha subsp. ruderalis]|uniref:Uncharacterized protein n=1 Tax=Marchantia polymorpha subsp. ruderalis TaxID=1480154 RepID=A0A176VG71_MARPO|nr:hypothetical protein AXG93_2396s1380 [Marchantia polymorpha subsp. ruderalis]
MKSRAVTTDSVFASIVADHTTPTAIQLIDQQIHTSPAAAGLPVSAQIATASAVVGAGPNVEAPAEAAVRRVLTLKSDPDPSPDLTLPDSEAPAVPTFTSTAAARTRSKEASTTLSPMIRKWF